MGVVYLARQTEPIQRDVAVKVLRTPFASPKARLRFESERQALARLSHPNVAQLFDAGTTETGLAYFAMEKVDGRPIVAASDELRLPIRRRLELFLEVCAGVQHAHQKGLIHRDLKPANVLLAETEGELRPKVIDFGIAKALDQPLSDQIVTGTALIGTPAYMSPETFTRSLGEPDPDTRSDVYALGLILYELILGAHPFDHEGASLPELMRRIVDRDAPSLLTRLGTLPLDVRAEVASTRAVSPTEHCRRLRGDLEWIVARAIARDREQRYESATALADDVRRYLLGEPVLAGPPSLRYRLGKLVRRHRLTAAAAALALLSLIGGGITSAILAGRASREARAAHEARAEAEEVAAFLGESFRLAAPLRSRGATITARELLDRGAERITSRFHNQPRLRAKMLLTLGQAYHDLGLFETAEKFSREAVTIYETETTSAGQKQLAIALNRLADSVDFAGRRSDAKPIYARALALEENASRESLASVQALNGLGTVARFEQDLGNAAAFHRRALNIAWHLGPTGRAAIARTLYLTGITETMTGRNVEAEAAYRESIALYIEIEGAETWNITGPQRALADLLAETGRFPEAEPLYLEVLARTERLAGSDAPSVAPSLNNLGATYWVQGRIDEAAVAWERALTINEKTLGPNHRETGYPVLNLGLVSLSRGELDRAAAIFDRATAIFRPTLDPGDETWGWLEWGRGRLELQRGRKALAEEHFRRALSVRQAALPLGHRDRREAARELATLLRSQGREREAAMIAANELLEVVEKPL